VAATGNPCPFCAIGSGANDADLVAFRTPDVFVVPRSSSAVRIPAKL
jgi:hypothetical protein